MSMKEELSKAIGAHGLWKSRLRTAVTSKRLDVPVATIKQADQCEFGKWLLSAGLAKEVQSARGKEVLALHAEFHRVAARVAELALSGRQQEAERQLANEGEFGLASAKLTLALMNWKESQ